MGCPRLTYELKTVYRAGEREATREEKVSRQNLKMGVDTGLFYYGARYYDPEISVWLSVDPLSSRDPWLSSYHFVKNNPVNLVDPLGLTWETTQDEETADKMSQSMNERKTDMESQLAKVIEQLASNELSKTEKRNLMMQKGILEQGIRDMVDGMKELQEMGDTKDMVFHFRAHVKGDGGVEAYRESDAENGISSITIGYKFGDEGNKVHETKHAYDLWKNTYGNYSPRWSGNSLKTKEFNFRMTGVGSSQYHFEYAAYRRQYFFDPENSPLSFSQLNEKDIKALKPSVYRW